MYIYRIELTDGTGPYASDEPVINRFGDEMRYAHSGCSMHPSMWEEHRYHKIPSGVSCEEYRCAFDTAEKLIAWFDGWFVTLDDYDYKVAIYEVTEYNAIIGKYQTIFRNGILIEHINILDFLQMV